MVSAFQNLLTENGEWWPSCEGLVFNELGAAETAYLEAHFSKEDAYTTLSNLCEDKAQGLDGFSTAFGQFSWDVLKEEVMGFFGEFYEHDRFVKTLNATFLVLIPKKEAEDFKILGLLAW